MIASQSMAAKKPKKQKMQLKRDVFWKGILRLFRRFVRHEALQQAEYKAIRKRPIEERGNLYAQALNLPKSLASGGRTPRLLVLLIDCHKTMGAIQPEYSVSMAYLGKYANSLIPQFSDIFLDNKIN